jgi:ABC-type antimicrobial peptide transport system permease subunit
VILRGVVRLVGVGCAAGVVLSVIVVQALRPLLAQGQSTLDPIAIISVLTILSVVGAAASVGPARRAARIDPSMALRSE